MSFGLLLLSFFSLTVGAAELDMARSASGDLILSAKSCDELKVQHQAICKWSGKTESTVTCKSLPKGRSQITISNCLPAFVKEHHSKKLFNEGPNCWGTAMSFHELFPKPRFMWPEEMLYWMESPLCRKLGPDEEKLPGDIINVFAPEYLSEGDLKDTDAGIKFWDILYPGRANFNVSAETGLTGYQRLLHSETYISDKIAFGKESPARDDKFVFHELEETLGRPRVENQDCQENQTFSPNLREYSNTPKEMRRSKCNYMSSLSRCQDINSYLKTNSQLDADKLTWKSIQAMQDIQEKLFSLTSSSTYTVPSSQVSLFLGLADFTMKKSSDELEKPGLSKLTEMLLVQEYFTAAGIHKTLEQAKLIKK
jgi:hypothetical protein